MDTVRCKARRAFTHFVEGHGQVHGDPDNKDKKAQNPAVPVHVVDRLVAEGCIDEPSAETAAAAEPAAKKGGKKAAAEPTADEAPAE